MVVKQVALPGSGVTGTGLFAAHDLLAGEVVLRLDWRDISCTEIVAWDETDDEHQDRATAIAPRWYFSPSTATRQRGKVKEHHPLWFLNHSCYPNLSYRNWAKCEDNSVVSLVALRQIKAGDHVVIDYSTMTTSDDGEEVGTAWTMKCLCGESNCRRRLTDFISLPRRLQLKMLLTRKPVIGIVPAFIVNESPQLVNELKRRAPDLYESFEIALDEQCRLAEYFEAASSDP